METTAACNLFPPQTKECGEFGACVNASRFICVCAPGYTQFGDFSLDAANPCDINLQAVQALWGLVIFQLAVATVAGLWGVLVRRKAKLMQWRAWRLWAVPYLVIVHAGFLLGVAVTKITAPAHEFNLGGSLAMTLLHGVCVMLSGTCVGLAVAGISHLTGEANIRSNSNESEHRILRLDRLMYSSWAVSVVFALIPLISINGRSDLVWIGAGLHGGWFSFLFLCWSRFAAPQALDLLIAQVSDSAKNALVKRSSLGAKKIDRFLLKLQWAKAFFAWALPLFSLGVLVVSCWPFLLSKTAYFLPLMWIGLEVVLVGVVWVTTTTSNSHLKRASMALVSMIRTRKSMVDLDGLPMPPPSPSL